MVNNHYRWDFIGLSTDVKPTPETSEKVVDGSTFYCSDNSKLYVFCQGEWYEKVVEGGGGSDINVVQTTGESTTDVMSQKAVTDALADAGGVTVVQTTGTSTTDVMSQNATTSMVYADPASGSKIKIGSSNYGESMLGNSSITLGSEARAAKPSSVAIGRSASAVHNGSVALGAFSSTSTLGQVHIGTTSTAFGYNSSNYRLLSGVHDPVNPQDAATKAYVDANAGGIKELSTADYNYPTNNPDRVALWLLEPGLYKIPRTGVSVYYSSNSIYLPSTYGEFAIIEQNHSGTSPKVMYFFGSTDGVYFANTSTSGSQVRALTYTLMRDRIVDDLTSTSASSSLSANQGKVLKDLIDALDARVSALEGN